MYIHVQYYEVNCLVMHTVYMQHYTVIDLAKMQGIISFIQEV